MMMMMFQASFHLPFISRSIAYIFLFFFFKVGVNLDNAFLHFRLYIQYCYDEFLLYYMAIEIFIDVGYIMSQLN